MISGIPVCRACASAEVWCDYTGQCQGVCLVHLRTKTSSPFPCVLRLWYEACASACVIPTEIIAKNERL